MQIIKAKKEDLSQIMKTIELGKKFMRDRGNYSQWTGNHPSSKILMEDIEKGNSYLVKEGDLILGVFSFIYGEDPTYVNIYQGDWLNNKEYYTIHRIASTGQGKGFFQEVMNWTKSIADNIKIDTHEDNDTMIYLLDKHDFKYCGKIYIEDGSQRLAYQWSKL